MNNGTTNKETTMNATAEAMMSALREWDEAGNLPINHPVAMAADKRLDVAARAFLGDITHVGVVYEGGSMGSRYYEVYAGPASIRVRFSNHAAPRPTSHGQPAWSFEPGDSGKSVENGIEAITAAMAAAIEEAAE
jgi:hypothetical protein